MASVTFSPGRLSGEALVPPAKSEAHRALLLAAFAGMLVVYIAGTAYCYVISRFVLGTEIAFWPLLISCFVLPFPGDAVLCAVSAMMGRRLIPQIKRYLP